MIEEVVKRVVQQLLRHAEGASHGVYGVLMWEMWMLAAAMLGCLRIMQRNIKCMLRLKCVGTKGIESMFGA